MAVEVSSACAGVAGLRRGAHPKMPPMPELPVLPDGRRGHRRPAGRSARMRWSDLLVERVRLDAVALGLGQQLRVGDARVVAVVARRALRGRTPGSGGRSPSGRVTGGSVLAISASLSMVLQAACSAPAPFGATLGDARVVGDERADVLAEAGPAHPDRHAVRRRSLLIRSGARGQGQSAPRSEHEGRRPGAGALMWPGRCGPPAGPCAARRSGRAAGRPGRTCGRRRSAGRC